MALEKEVQKLTEDLAKLNESLKEAQDKHHAEIMKMLAVMSAERTATAERFEVLDLRLNETKGFSIHDENRREVPNVREKMPEEPTLTDLPKFTGSEDPLVHVKAFKGQMALKGVNSEYFDLVFPHSLGPNPQAWFYSLDLRKFKTFNDIAIAFTEQYKDNVETKASIRTLEITIQGEKEGFTEFLARWRAISTQLTNKPSEVDLVNKFVKNTRSPYYEEMRYTHIENFRQLIDVGTKIEDDQRSKATAKQGYQGSPSQVDQAQVNAVDILNNTKEEPERRAFTPLGMSYADAFRKLCNKGKLQAIGPTKDPEKKHRSWNGDEYCDYHRGNGHTIERCFRLRHKIEDMIESGELENPADRKKPSTTTP